MITTEGKRYIKRFMAGQVPAIAGSIAFGIGGSVEALTDTSLHFEIDRSDIVLISYDFVNDRLVFKAPVPDTYVGTITEAALFSESINSAAGNFGSKLISTFDSENEEWFTGASPSTFSSTFSRVGGDSLRHTATASSTVSSTLDNIEIDLSGNSDADKFLIAYNNTNSFTANFKVKFMTDASNYYTLTVTSPSTSYRISSVLKGDATVTGAPSWGQINSIEVTSTATAGGTSTMDFDAIRIEDMDTVNPDYVLIAREVLGTPFVKEVGKVQDIEYSLDVSL